MKNQERKFQIFCFRQDWSHSYYVYKDYAIYFISPGSLKLQLSNSMRKSKQGQHYCEYQPTAHYCDVIMGTMASQITTLTIVFSIVHSGADQRKHKSSVSLAFVRGIHRWPVNSPHKGPVTRKIFPFDDIITSFSTFIHFTTALHSL